MPAAKKIRAQLSVEELQQLRWLLGGVLILVSVWTVFYLDVSAWTVMLLATAGVLAGLINPTLPARLPKSVHLLAFPAVVSVFIADLWLVGEILPAMVRLDILLLLYRGIVYRQKRDDLQVIVLGLFLVIVAGVLTVSLIFAVQILLFVLCALAFLMVITLTDGIVNAATTKGAIATDRVPVWARHVSWRQLTDKLKRATDWRVALVAAGLFVALVAVSALLFLAIPRFQLENSLFLERFITKKTKTGFSDSIRFGDVTEIQRDNAVALSVDVSDRARIPAAPYWRMLVLDEYRDGTFRLSPQLRGAAFSREQSLTSVRGTVRGGVGEPLVWTFYLESGVSRYLPLLGIFQALRFQEVQNVSSAQALGLVALRNEPATMTAYRVAEMETGPSIRDAAFARLVAEPPRTTKGKSAAMLGLQLTDAESAVLARINAEITRGAPVAAPEFGQRAATWLGGRHGYSLNPTIPRGTGDPVVRWLDSKESGHCELFAGSLVVLARSAGIPARVVTGFRGGSWNGYSNNFTLRNSDAHAWCELYDLHTKSWVRVDATPGATNAGTDEAQAEAALQRRTDRSWTARLDSLRIFWYRRIVNFDQRTQIDALRSVKAATENSGKRIRAVLENLMAALKQSLSGPWNVNRVIFLLSALIAVAVLVSAWRQIRHRGFSVFRLKWRGRSADIRAQAGRWLQRLERQPHDTESAHLRADLQRLRYGAQTTWPEATRVFRQARIAARARVLRKR